MIGAASTPLCQLDCSYGASPLQEGMIFHSVSAAKPGVDIVQIVGDLEEDLNLPAFERAWQSVVRRHPILRTCFRWEALDRPRQEVRSETQIRIETADWSSLPADVQRDRLENWLRADRRRGFDLSAWPLMRWTVVRVAPARSWFVWTFHHALLDARSFALVLQEFFLRYDSTPGPSLNEPASYRDYLEWLSKLDLAAAEKFWRQRLKEFTAPTSPTLRTAPTRAPETDLGPGEQQIALANELSGTLRVLARQQGLTVNTLVHGAWAIVLSRFSGQEDVVFGAVRACRNSDFRGAESVVGLLINTLPLRVRIERGSRLADWLSQLREQWTELRAYEHTPLVKIQQWSELPAGTPLFETIVNYHPCPWDTALRAGDTASPKRTFSLRVQTNYPLMLDVCGEPELTLKLVYDRSRFDDPAASRMLCHLRALLEGMAADPRQFVGDLATKLPAEERAALRSLNRTESAPAKTWNVVQFIEEQARRKPEATALICGHEQLNYADLWSRVEGIAARLQEVGVGPEVIVGVCVERSVAMVAALLGVLKAGGAFVPLDPAYPEERLRYMVKDSQAAVLLVQDQWLGRLCGLGALAVSLDRADPCGSRIADCGLEKSDRAPRGARNGTARPRSADLQSAVSQSCSLRSSSPSHASTVVRPSADWKSVTRQSATPRDADEPRESLAYVIYTSGSTGKPKGVMVNHRNLVNLFPAMDEVIGVDPGVWLAVSRFSFDISILELIWTLARGFKVVIQPETRFSNAAQTTLKRCEVESLKEFDELNAGRLPCNEAPLVGGAGGTAVELSKTRARDLLPPHEPTPYPSQEGNWQPRNATKLPSREGLGVGSGVQCAKPLSENSLPARNECGEDRERTTRLRRKMDFSLFYFACDEAAQGADKYRLLVEGAKFADQHGFAAVWTPERHFHRFGGLYPNPSVASAALAMVTRHLQLRAGSVVLPLHHPIRVVEEWAVVDNLSNGRVGVSFASGWHANDFVFAPGKFADRRRLFREEIEITRRLWRGESLRCRNGRGEQAEVRVFPRPVQSELPIWITAAGNPETFQLAGELGANLLTNLLGQTVEELAQKISLYREAWRKAGHGPKPGSVALMLHTFVGDDLDQVREKVRRPFIEYLKTSTDLIRLAKWEFPTFGRNRASGPGGGAEKNLSEKSLEEMAAYSFERYFNTSGLFGPPDLCLRSVEKLRNIGVNEIACLIDFGVEFDAVLASLERLNEVRQRANRIALRRPGNFVVPASWSAGTQRSRVAACNLATPEVPPRAIQPTRSESGDCADSVAAVQNLAVRRRLTGSIVAAIPPRQSSPSGNGAANGHQFPLSNESLASLIQRHGVTHLQCTPSLISALVDDPQTLEALRSLRKLMLGGEALPAPLARRLNEALPGEVFNFYGPTETTIWSTAHRFKKTERDVCIGQPVRGTQIYVLDQRLEPVPFGVVGELYIGGQGVARGYRNRPDWTADRFIPDSFGSELGARLYRTGDLGRFLPDGNIELIGRADQQVKVRGHRVELGEIEAVLAEHPAVRTAVVRFIDGKSGDQKLAAYVELRQSAARASNSSENSRVTSNSASDGTVLSDGSTDLGSTAVESSTREGRASPSQRASSLSSDCSLLGSARTLRPANSNLGSVAPWRHVWDEIYRQSPSLPDPTFNLLGWRSSYDGALLSEPEMREWLENTVNRILALQPKRVLEIGCGVGLLLFRIAPRCESYCATDFSAPALRFLEEHIRSRDLSQVTLRLRDAHDFSGFEPGAFDTIILNSVVQYFPDREYLLRVLQQAARALAPGGTVFLGDIRSLPLLDLFHTAVELRKAPPPLPLRALMERIRARVEQEKELLIAPDFFLALKQEWPRLDEVCIQLKRGSHHNELTAFRYDAALRFDPPRSRDSSESLSTKLDCQEIIDWRATHPDLNDVRRILAEQKPGWLSLMGVPNARLRDSVAAWGLLASCEDEMPVSELQRLVDRKQNPAVDPEESWALGAELAYAVDITWSQGKLDGSYDVLFHRPLAKTPSLSSIRAFLSREPRERIQAEASGFNGFGLQARSQLFERYTNSPWIPSHAPDLTAALKEHLRARLPDHMVPASITVLDEFPRTPNGKIDRNAVSGPESTDAQPKTEFCSPRNELEQRIASVFQDALQASRVGLEENFFDLGVHSLLAMRVANQLRLALGRPVNLLDLFRYPTVRVLAAHLSGTGEPIDAPDPGRTRAEKRRTRTKIIFRST